MKNFDILNITSNKDLQVILSFRTGQTGEGVSLIKGWLTSEFGWNASVSSSPWSSLVFDTINKVMRETAFFGKPISQGLKDLGVLSKEESEKLLRYLNKTGSARFMSAEASKKVWDGTSNPAFSLPFYIIALNEKDDVRNEVAKLFDYVYPSGQTVGGIKKLPLYKSPKGIGTDKTNVMLRIGTWFKMGNLFITSLDVKFSKEVHTNGTPLYAELTIGLESKTFVTSKEMKATLGKR